VRDRNPIHRRVGPPFAASPRTRAILLVKGLDGRIPGPPRSGAPRSVNQSVLMKGDRHARVARDPCRHAGRWGLPKERRADPDFSTSELESIARREASRSPRLTPNGGRRWTREDIAFAVSVLAAEARSPAFGRAWTAGMTRERSLRWLAKALHHRLLDRTRRLRRMKFIDDPSLEALPTSHGRGRALDAEDRAVLVTRVLGGLTEAGRAVAAEMLRVDGYAVARVEEVVRRPRVAQRTRERERARVRDLLRGIVTAADLSREEALDLLHALAAGLAGGGLATRSRFVNKLGGFGPRRSPDPV